MANRGGATPEVRFRAAERERQIVALRVRGIPFETIGQQLGISRQIANKLFNRALRRLPPSINAADMRRLEDERIAEMRARCWSELAGRDERKPDRQNPGQFITVTKLPTAETVKNLIDSLVRISRHEARLHGLDAPKETIITSPAIGPQYGGEVTPEQWVKMKARLSLNEWMQWLELSNKLNGVGPQEQPAIETTVT